MLKECEHCGGEYESKRSTSKYCSAKCRKLAFHAVSVLSVPEVSVPKSVRELKGGVDYKRGPAYPDIDLPLDDMQSMAKPRINRISNVANSSTQNTPCFEPPERALDAMGSVQDKMFSGPIDSALDKLPDNKLTQTVVCNLALKLLHKDDPVCAAGNPCMHCQAKDRNKSKNIINHGPYKDCSELSQNEINRVSLLGDIDYKGLCREVDGEWLARAKNKTKGIDNEL